MNSYSKKSGNGWGMITMNDPMPCPQAISWAKKLMAPGASGTAMMPHEVSGGPAGFKCFLTPDGNGHAMGGTCHTYDSKGNIKTSFDWLPASDQ